MSLDRFDRAIALSMSWDADPNRTYATPEEYAQLKAVLSTEQTYPCPFCKRLPCPHWDGLGWNNPKFQSANTEKAQAPVEPGAERQKQEEERIPPFHAGPDCP